MNIPLNPLRRATGKFLHLLRARGPALLPGLTCALLVGGFAVTPLLRAQQAAKAGGTARNAPKLTGKYTDDAEVLREAQEAALQMARDLKAKSENPRTSAALDTAIEEMERALKLVTEAKDSPAKLQAAVAAQQAAYAALLKLAEREFRVSQGKSSKSKGGGGGEEARQRQLDQLEMKTKENRYETQRQATPEQSPEQREQLQFMSRLRELAQRQQDVNERLKELQTALQEAKTEEDKEEIRRRLKRLREEEQQMLADLDELKQRAEKPENQSRMAETKEKLEQTREAAQRAAEAMEKGNVPQALSAATRAQRQMQEMRDELRKKSSNQFAEDMRQMREEARELAKKQEDLGNQLEKPTASKRKSLTEPEGKTNLSKELAGQNQRLTELVGRATHVSEQAEIAEPLLHRQLYDTLRKQAQSEAQNLKETKNDLARRGMLTRGMYETLEKASAEGSTKSLEVASELVKLGMNSPATQVEQRARRGIDELRRGVERAAESVLGDEAEALRQAAKNLDELTRQLGNELARAEQAGQKPGEENQPGRSGEGKQPSQRGKSGQAGAPKEGEPGEKSGQRAQAGKGGEKGEEPAEGAKEGEPGEPGEGKGKGKEGGQGTGKAGEKGDAKGAQSGKGKGEGKQPAEGKEGEGQGQGQRGEGAPAKAGQKGEGEGGGAANNQRGGNDRRGGNRGGFENILPAGIIAERGAENAGPITGSNFENWSDRLRDVEEMVDSSSLRNELTSVRELARAQRVDFKRHSKEPQWDLVRTQIFEPLVVIRQRIAEDLARRDSREAMVPIDRDPVPGRFADLVRRYYENLGKADEK